MSRTAIEFQEIGRSTESRVPATSAGLLIHALLFVRTAWMADDAYITFRTIDNFLNGYGLRWNIDNRVQTYTHPLWMLLMTAATAITREVYFTAIFVSIALSLAVVVLISSGLAASLPAALLALSTLALSKSFVEYSVSGLENPLTHLLLVGFFIVYFGSRPRAGASHLFGLALMAALLMLNRHDAGLLVLPALIEAWWSSGARRPWRIVAAGMLPFLAWELFAIVYYGFPFPNTAYAKLKTGVPRAELVQQGLLYLLDSLSNDPITPLTISAAVVSPFVLRSGWAIPSGVVLYIAYVVWVGGDFMSGRFLSAPLVCSVVYLARQPIPRFSLGWALAIGLVWLVGLSAPRPVILSNAAHGADIKPDEAIPGSHITDERRYYYPYTGLLTAHRGVPMPDHRWYHLGEEAKKRGERLALTDAAGFIGYAAGPGVHYVDRWGLGDPLLARLPAEVPWEIGHYARQIPAGYLETLEHGRTVIRDPGLAAYYERLRIITEGPLWSRERLRTIVRMNLGRYERFIASYGVIRVRLEEVSTSKPDGAEWNRPDNIVMTSRGIEIAVPVTSDARSVQLSLSRNDAYRVEFLRNGHTVAERRIDAGRTSDSSLLTRTVDVPARIEFDALAVKPSSGDSRYSLGHVRILRQH